MFSPKRSRWPLNFFTFLTSLAHHLSMVTFSEKKSMLENFHNRSFINREFDLPHRPNFLSAFLVLFKVFLQFKGIFKGVSRINLLEIIPERFHRMCLGQLCDLEVLTTTILLKICYLAICISILENTKWWLFVATSLSYYIYYVKNSSFFYCA